MAILPINPRLPTNAQTPFERDLIRLLHEQLRAMAIAINDQRTGKFSQHNAGSATKPTLPGSLGDFVPNTAQTVLGTVGSQYIVLGWRYGDDDLWHDVSELTDG